MDTLPSNYRTERHPAHVYLATSSPHLFIHYDDCPTEASVEESPSDSGPGHPDHRRLTVIKS